MTKFILILLLTLLCETTFAWSTPPLENQKQYLNNKNQLKNGGFENGSANWTASGGTFAATTTSAQVFVGARAGSWDASSNSQTLTSSTWTTKTDASGNGEASCRIKTAATDYVMQVYDGTNVIESIAIRASDSSEFKLHSVNFAIGATSTGYRIRFVSASDAAVMYVDDCYLGYATNIANVSQSTYLGSWTWTGATNCARSTTSTSYATFAADADCNNPTVTGQAAAPSTKILAAAISGGVWGPGNYEFVLQGSGTVLSTGAAWQCRMLGGANGSIETGTVFERDSATADYDQGSYVMTLNLTSAYTGEIEFQCKTSTGTLSFTNGGSTQNITLTAKKFPLESQIAYTQDQANFGWTQYTPNFTGFGTVTVHACYYKREGEDLLLRCRFTPGTATGVEARVSLPGTLVSKSTIATLELAGYMQQVTTTTSQYAPTIEAGVGYVTFAVQSGGTNGVTKANGNTISGGANALSFFARVPIQSWTSTNVPALLGSVITQESLSPVRILSANLNCDSGSAITSQLGSWVSSIGNISSGGCAITLNSGVFSAAPYCTATATGSARILRFTSTSGTSIAMNCIDDSGTLCTSFDFFITCMGPK
ncbi:hypothetical protein EKK58_08755 [Candidatus Dependentiae bacterium]|nr:MAG: hypothetical protein EKK58_08755 [Candidatus Dependentiae bacterium]